MRTILLADDEKAIREFCRRELEDEGYRVVLARDGQEAVEVLRNEHPDLAVLDLSMPRLDGMAAAARIRTLYPEIPVVFFTAHEEDCLADPRSRLAIACVEKSEDLGELKRTIARGLAASEAPI